MIFIDDRLLGFLFHFTFFMFSKLWPPIKKLGPR